MKRATKLLLFSSIIAIMVLSSCFDNEVFSDIPEIEFRSLEFIDTDSQDSLVLRFSFKDENGDIGLGTDEIFEPYNSSFGVTDSAGDIVTIEGDFVPPYSQVPIALLPLEFVLKDSLNVNNQQSFREEVFDVYQRVGDVTDLGDGDPRPETPSCNDFVLANFYSIEDVNSIYQELVPSIEEILILRNEFHHNFHIDFYRKSGENYTLIDFDAIFNSCTDSFDGRIPIFDPNGKEGTITYTMLSQGFRLAFLDDTIRAEFYVYDRALNRSNLEQTEDFVLRSLPGGQ